VVCVQDSDEAVTPLGKSLDEAWVVGRVVERLAEPVDGLVQAMIEIHKGTGRPKALGEFFARNHFAGPLEQSREDLEGFFLKDGVVTVATKFACMQVQFELGEADEAAGFRSIGHGKP
jgi:hypothetical protein